MIFVVPPCYFFFFFFFTLKFWEVKCVCHLIITPNGLFAIVTLSGNQLLLQLIVQLLYITTYTHYDNYNETQLLPNIVNTLIFLTF